MFSRSNGWKRWRVELSSAVFSALALADFRVTITARK
jgi:hypothetical protein